MGDCSVESRIRSAIILYEEEITNRENWIKKDGKYQYRHRVSVRDILERAGVKSRSTMLSPIHAGINAFLRSEVVRLKGLAGKIAQVENNRNEENSVAIMAQIIAAQDLRIAELESEIAQMKNKSVGKWSG